MMLHFFSSKYIVAALAMMAMTMTYNINNSNGVVNAEDACKAIDGNLQLCTSGSCTCGEYDCPADHICGNCEDDVSPCSASSVSSTTSSGDASGDVASAGDVSGASAACYSCTFTGKLCAVPFTECTGPSTPCSEDYTGDLKAAECTATAAEASGDVGASEDVGPSSGDVASADAETNVVAGGEASAQTAQEDGEAAMNEDNMDSINDTEAAAEADASTTAAAAENGGTNTVATNAEAAAQVTAENADQSENEANSYSVSDASTTATDAVNTAATTATDAVNNSVKVEVSSAALLSSSMMGIAAVTIAFVAIA